MFARRVRACGNNQHSELGAPVTKDTTATNEDVLIYGSSDDILCVMGQGLDEELDPAQEEDKVRLSGIV